MARLSDCKTFGIVAAAGLALLLGFARPARAVTVHDLVALSQAGLSDQVLIALIQTDRTIYGVDANEVLVLRKAGVSEPVILALLHNGRDLDKQDAASTEEPTERAPTLTIVGDHSRDRSGENQAAPAQSTIVVQTIVPEFVPVPIVIGGHAHSGRGRTVHPASVVPGYTGFGRFINNGFITGSAAHTNIGGTSITADGWRIVTPRVVPARVPGQL